MKALALTQPWASLIACGAKRIETRSWRTDYRGLLAIYAAKNLDPVGGRVGLERLVNLDAPDMGDALFDAGWASDERGNILTSALPLGAFVAVVRLGAIIPTDALDTAAQIESHLGPLPTERERLFGDYGPGRYAWLLGAVSAVDPPYGVPKGSIRDYRGVFDVPPSLAATLCERAGVPNSQATPEASG